MRMPKYLVTVSQHLITTNIIAFSRFDDDG